MFGSETLEVAIGIIFVFLLVSIMASAIREGMEAWFKTRAAYLEKGIRELLHDAKAAEKATSIARSVYEHPLIYGLYPGDYTPGTATQSPPLIARGGNLPTYIPSRNFALALMDIAARGPATDALSSGAKAPPISLESMRRNVANLGSAPVQRVLLTAIDSAQGDIDNVQAALEAWYDSSMDRVSGWYKRSTSWILFMIGLALAAALNINTITIGDYLYRHDSERQVLVARAQSAAADPAYIHQSYADAKATLGELHLPIGWSGWGAPRLASEHTGVQVWNDGIAPVLGILLTALAVTMGAPFWFDVLNKVMVIRSTVKPHEKSPEEASEDKHGDIPATPATPAGWAFVGARPVEQGAGGGGGSADDTPTAGGGDAERNVDGCGGPVGAPTPDDRLPAADGGIA